MAAHLVDAADLAEVLRRLVAAAELGIVRGVPFAPNAPALKSARVTLDTWHAQKREAEERAAQRRADMLAANNSARLYALAHPDKMKRDPRCISAVAACGRRCAEYLAIADRHAVINPEHAAKYRGHAEREARNAERHARDAYERAKERR